MSEDTKKHSCVVIGASHAGVNLAFSLRREGWLGEIIMYDADSMLPYHRPPLSKAYLTSEDGIEKNLLKAKESYEKENIRLHLGVKVESIHRENKSIRLNNGAVQGYDKLVLATGARPIMPPIPGLSNVKNVFPMRTANDSNAIRSAVLEHQNSDVVVIGGGYIGLETAASLKKLGAKVTVLEREERILARVTAPEMSDFFRKLHTENGVVICTSKNVESVTDEDSHNQVVCADGSRYRADIIIVGVGIHVNTELAEKADLKINNGILVDGSTRTTDLDIHAIGDCTFHHNQHYNRLVRLESVQNAVDQAKVAAAVISGKETTYNSIPWFWSDQYGIKLQMVGLANGYDKTVIRKEAENEHCFSIWYFKGDSLLAVDAVNNTKAYVYGTKFIKGGAIIDKLKLEDPSTIFKPEHLLSE